MPITPAQSRAARGLLDWSQTDLGKRANLSESTVRDFEKGRRVPSVNNLAAIERAFEQEGVELTNGDQPGVKLTRPYVPGTYSRAVEIDPNPRLSVGKDPTGQMVASIETKPTGPATDVVKMMDKAIEEHESSIPVEDLNSSNDE